LGKDALASNELASRVPMVKCPLRIWPANGRLSMAGLLSPHNDEAIGSTNYRRNVTGRMIPPALKYNSRSWRNLTSMFFGGFRCPPEIEVRRATSDLASPSETAARLRPALARKSLNAFAMLAQVANSLSGWQSRRNPNSHCSKDGYKYRPTSWYVERAVARDSGDRFSWRIGPCTKSLGMP